ncbi:MAG: SDR family NAD(P)-dependent oxidoreductase [Candidatus Poseidoniales archaeon]|nr:MAG: SDR family NAD(P)-dependent oxidoreductase [Candidatus Poseidoniales archaeon]|tara:strand:+ start:484 stop:1161 length:678 start_codon:yes stop_codon:yes gene_type:complete
MRVAVITGANRGIGNHWTNRLLENGWIVYAGYREDMGGLGVIEHDNLIALQLDVTNTDSIEKFVENINGNVNLLINNAGVPDGRWRNLTEIDDEWALDVLNINSLGPVRMVKALYPKMLDDGLTKIVMISSLMGSIDDCHMGKSYAYRASKTALNMFTVAMKKECIEDNISFLIFHPGWVKTRMGGDRAPVDIEESVEGMMKILENHTIEDSGVFIQYDGQKIKW